MSSNGTPGRLRALVADHDRQQCATLEAAMERLNADVQVANDAATLWSLVVARSFDIAVIDLGIPDLDAAHLIEFMRGHPRSKHLPIIVVSGTEGEAAIAPALAAGASSFVSRPIAAPLFEHSLTALLRMVAAARQERTAAHRSLAVHRAIEAVLGNLAGEAAVGTAWLDEEIEGLRRLPLPPDAATMVMHRINRISRECRALQVHAAKSAVAIAALGEKVVADDRHESLAAIIDAVVADPVIRGAVPALPVEMKLPAGEIWIACDAEGLQQALAHLIQNALVHNGEGAQVSVTADIYPDGLLGIEVTDHGRGIHPDVFARTSAPLQARIDGSRAGPYMGFGLLFAKAIAEAHGGRLELRSMPDQGTTALLTLPPERVVYRTAAEPA